ncbi:MAG: EamA family transporter [Bacteriovoracaceae bacterium]
MNLLEIKPEHSVYYYVIGSNLAFAIGSLIFAQYSRLNGAKWMNCIKALIATFAFGVFNVFTFGFDFFNSLQFFGLFLSGFIGLGIGDIFLLKAFQHFGPGRTSIVFGFQPLIIGVLSFFLFGQAVSMNQMIAIAFFMGCLFVISFEQFKVNQSWEFKGLIAALIGVSMDACGIVVTRYAFDLDPRLSSLEGNFYRCLGALFAFVIISRFVSLELGKKFKKLSSRQKSMVVIGSLLGTFISLGLYLNAVQTGHLASIAGIAITGSLFSNSVECLAEKKWPSVHLLISFALFLIGSQFLL